MADIGFNINNFKSRIDTDGILQNNKFLVEIPMPPIIASQPNNPLRQTLASAQQDIQFWCEAANIPGIGLMTNEVRNYGYGPVEKKPYAARFTDVNLSIISDGYSKNLDLLQEWVKSIINFDLSTSINGAASGAGLAPFEVSYKDDYAVDIKIRIFDPQGYERSRVVLFDAYPVFVADIPLNWNDTNSAIKIPATFTFISWWIEKGTQS